MKLLESHSYLSEEEFSLKKELEDSTQIKIALEMKDQTKKIPKPFAKVKHKFSFRRK